MRAVSIRHGQITNLPGPKPLASWLVQIISILLCGVSPVLAAELKILPGHVPSILPRLVPKASLPATNELRLAIGLQMRDRAGLKNLAARISDPASPDFRHFISREELT